MLLPNVMLVLSLFLVLAASGIGSVSATARVPPSKLWSSKEEYTLFWLNVWIKLNGNLYTNLRRKGDKFINYLCTHYPYTDPRYSYNDAICKKLPHNRSMKYEEKRFWKKMWRISVSNGGDFPKSKTEYTRLMRTEWNQMNGSHTNPIQEGDEFIQELCKYCPEEYFSFNDVICHKLRSKQQSGWGN